MLKPRLSILLCLFLLNAAVTPVLAKSKSGAPAGAGMGVMVEAEKIAAVTWQPQVESTGTVVAEQGIVVRSEIPGRVVKIYFQSGDQVKYGQPLVLIYPDILKAQLKANEAALKLSALNYERSQKLYEKKVISKSDLDTSTSQYQSSQAQVEQTKAQLEQTFITAAFDGSLGIRQVNLGDYVSAGQALVNLQRLDPVFVDFSVPEKYIPQIQVGETVQIRSNAYGDRTFAGKVVAKDSLVDVMTRTINVRSEVPNQDHALIPGSFVEVSLLMGKPAQLISVPQTAIVYSAEGSFVYKIVDGKAVQTPVTLGTRLDTNILIIKGLQVGDVVITAGQQKLANGAPVTVQGTVAPTPIPTT